VEQPLLSTSAASCDGTDFDRCRSRLERFYSGAPPHKRADAQEAEVPTMTTPTKASERYDTNEIDLLSEESCASSSDSDDCTAHSDALRKRIKQDDFELSVLAEKEIKVCQLSTDLVLS